MDHNLNSFNEVEDFKQFAELNNLSVADPETHRQYSRWTIDRLLEKREKQIIRAENFAEGFAEGLAEGIVMGIAQDRVLEVLLKDLKRVQKSNGSKIKRD
ncbi:MAG: hypothetical protein LBS60_04775 [Deltaproteobacteria bacterium]|nr:hypothetical protein [Deltaproteobacteria bacterium]